MSLFIIYSVNSFIANVICYITIPSLNKVLYLVSLYLVSLKPMIEACESFAKLHFIEFKAIKSKLLCLNCDTLNVPIFFNGKRIPVVSRDRHLGNFISQLFWIGIRGIMLAISINVVIG